MVSVREIKRIFEKIAPDRQLPLVAITEFQTRAERILEQFAEFCNEEAGGDKTKTRLTVNHVKIASVNFNDRVIEKKEDDLEFGEWNTGDDEDE
jgi:hypothetical protein|tara:strand:+ start:2458 stop:2739 length:282 start_codon:yes stop_codon:yes gene_type:complete